MVANHVQGSWRPYLQHGSLQYNQHRPRAGSLDLLTNDHQLGGGQALQYVIELCIVSSEHCNTTEMQDCRGRSQQALLAAGSAAFASSTMLHFPVFHLESAHSPKFEPISVIPGAIFSASCLFLVTGSNVSNNL